ncbi:hypothetical protein [Bosea massiliensis]|jgi:hypothetical protein|uniref:Uncharacterized protein n=1 Tax=Bosea massiliensis TaxID=151419 RepID=A0ABW0NZ92_9HYPH
MQSVAKTAGHHATMLLEPMTDFAITEAARAAFIRNFRNRVTDIDTISTLMFAEADALGIECNCVGDIDLTPTADKDVFLALDRLLDRIPVGSKFVFRSIAYGDLLSEVHCELFYLWRKRLEGVREAKTKGLAA